MTKKDISKSKISSFEPSKKRDILTSFFETVFNLSEKDALDIVNKVEHTVSDENLRKFQHTLIFLDSFPMGGLKIKNSIKLIDKNQDYIKNCEACISDFFKECSGNKFLDSHTLTLDKLKIGDKAEIVKLRRNPLLAKRFCEMGGVAGTLVKVEKIAPFGDPISIKLKGTEISIRKEEAENILVKKIDN